MGDPDRPRLWPAFAACAAAAVTALVLALVAVHAKTTHPGEAEPPSPMTVVAVWPQDARVVRAVTREGGCRRQRVAAEVETRSDVVTIGLYGEPSRGDCAAVTKYRCFEVMLEEPVGRRLLVPHPGPTREWERRFVRRPCPRVPLR